MNIPCVNRKINVELKSDDFWREATNRKERLAVAAQIISKLQIKLHLFKSVVKLFLLHALCTR